MSERADPTKVETVADWFAEFERDDPDTKLIPVRCRSAGAFLKQYGTARIVRPVCGTCDGLGIAPTAKDAAGKPVGCQVCPTCHGEQPVSIVRGDMWIVARSMLDAHRRSAEVLWSAERLLGAIATALLGGRVEVAYKLGTYRVARPGDGCWVDGPVIQETDDVRDVWLLNPGDRIALLKEATDE